MFTETTRVHATPKLSMIYARLNQADSGRFNTAPLEAGKKKMPTSISAECGGRNCEDSGAVRGIPRLFGHQQAENVLPGHGAISAAVNARLPVVAQDVILVLAAKDELLVGAVIGPSM